VVQISSIAELSATTFNLESKQPGARTARILLIEDDHDLAHDMASELLDRSYEVVHADTGGKGIEEARSRNYDLVILDVLLPECDGLTIIRELRRDQIRVPVLVTSSLGAVADRVRGLKTGGDDYLTKPFALLELSARVEALLRRPLATPAIVLRVGSLELDLIDRVARRSGKVAKLSKSEFKLLEYFMRRPDRVITREMLLKDVWDYRGMPQTNVVDVHISQLRRKIDPPGNDPMLLNIRGAGFMIRDAS
jgi:two-component system, OmpR family, response regulator